MILMLGTGLIKGAIPSALWKTGFTTGHSPRRRGRRAFSREKVLTCINERIMKVRAFRQICEES